MVQKTSDCPTWRERSEAPAKVGETYALADRVCPGTSPTAIRRAAVLFDTPHRSAAWRTLRPVAAT